MLLGTLVLTAPLSGLQAPDRSETADFVVLFQSRAVGTETVTLTESPAGWLISATNSIGAPFDLTTSKFQLRYAADWQPESLALEGTRAEQLITLATTFTETTATSQVLQGGMQTSATHQVSKRTVVLPNGFYAPYQALAAQLGSASVGTRFPLYVAPQGEITATVVRVAPHRLTTSSGPIDLREFDLTFANRSGPLTVEVWIDGRNRLARMAMPASGLTVIRADLSSVMTREATLSRLGDQDVFFPALGFSLAGTVSKPPGLVGPGPAVVLIAGAGQLDRDERLSGIPLFGQIASALADEGFVVARYDKRGLGRSGGRMESATLADYAGDAVSVIASLRKRPDVDPNRIAVVGYAEGGAIALLAGSQDKRIAALGLLAAPGQTGREITLLQQQHALARTNEPEASKRAKTEMQWRVLDAVVKGTGWEGIPPEVQGQADNAWFKSWLLFDPAVALAKVNQPVLIMEGSLDVVMPPAQADRLETLARARKKLPETATRKVVVPGVNHLFVASTTGEEDEYPRLAGQAVSPAVTSALADWLRTAMPKKK